MVVGRYEDRRRWGVGLGWGVAVTGASDDGQRERGVQDLDVHRRLKAEGVLLLLLLLQLVAANTIDWDSRRKSERTGETEEERRRKE